MRRNPLIQASISILGLAVIALAALAGCGPGGRNSAPGAPLSALDRKTSTGAANDQGQLFTAYTTEESVEAIKAQVQDFDYNRDFGSQIEEATVLPPHPQSVEPEPKNSGAPFLAVNLRWKNINDPLVFQGQLQKQGNNFYSTLTETTGQRSDLQMTASCSDAQCTHGNFLVFDGQNHRAAIVVTKEDRVIKLKAAASQPARINPDEEKLEEQYKQGQPVTVISTQIFPGRSYFELQQKDLEGNQTPLEIKGDLVEPGGDCPSLQVNDPGKKLGGACLLGNDEEGDLLFRVTPETENAENQSPQKENEAPAPKSAQKENPKKGSPSKSSNPAPAKAAVPQYVSAPLYLELAPRDETADLTTYVNTKPSPNGGTSSTSKYNSNCPINVGPDAKPLVVKIMADCGYPEVVKYINKVWGPKGRSINALKEFLDLNSQSQEAHPTGRAAQFKQMLSTLSSNDYPQIVSFITLVESRFRSNAVSSTGALGFWQFTAGTARFVHLPLNQRTQIVPSTKAFVREFNFLLTYWDGDFKMALSSYNRGQGNVENAGANLQKRWQNDPNVPEGEKEAYSVFKDFWYIYKYYMMRRPKDGWDYVPTIMAAMFAGASPESYGLEGVQGMGMK